MITDVFSAEPGQLPGYREAGFPDPTGFGFPTIRARGLDPAALAILDALLSQAAPAEALESAATSPTDAPDLYRAPVITMVSARTVQLLPAVDQNQLTVLADDWAEYDELGGKSPIALRAFLDQAQELFRSAAANDRIVCVWNCL
ncbi:hypothetical protein BIV57_02065 [Mangrovactinospora gilvigrisea]|uniref:DUF1877 domain-containing protein n=1 Tax=Mangrovactinospora gilvigrisea TaxID=1428644 RepID=A0A1J7BKC5_9ACTN|nr:hypothetical protein [Mangrovactinospora gilvigrisea]OIV39139.1 hypothetical protein BIV57_02065 [Mangrovactinospora gilvigrisea]